jgi:RNA polymerase sigma factor (sigma-70 family)
MRYSYEESGNPLGVAVAGNTRETPVAGAGKTSLAGAQDGHHALIALFDDGYQRYYVHVLAFLRFRVGAPDVAEDLTALVFERALTHLADLQAPEAACAWLFRIARNCATDYFRQRRPEESLETLAAAYHPCAASAEEVTLASEERAALLAHLSRLSEREREVIGLKFVARLHNREIARVLSIPERMVGSTLHRALGRLRDARRAEGGTG